MKHENGYWIDENNNRWGECCGKERAKELSSSMINCDNCCGCYCCERYTENPTLYRTDRIGSRKDRTTFYYGKTEKGMSLQVVCGCFRGDLEEFEKAVLKTHADNDIYREQYLKEIQKVKALFELEENEVESLNKNGKGEIMKGE